jgi:hypothetical protein
MHGTYSVTIRRRLFAFAPAMTMSNKAINSNFFNEYQRFDSPK